MDAIEDLKRILDLPAPSERHAALETWQVKWLLHAEIMRRVKRSDVEKSEVVQGLNLMLAKIGNALKDEVFTAIGRDRSLMFHVVRPVGDLLEFRLALAVVRPVPAPDAPAEPEPTPKLVTP